MWRCKCTMSLFKLCCMADGAEKHFVTSRVIRKEHLDLNEFVPQELFGEDHKSLRKASTSFAVMYDDVLMHWGGCTDYFKFCCWLMKLLTILVLWIVSIIIVIIIIIIILVLVLNQGWCEDITWLWSFKHKVTGIWRYDAMQYFWFSSCFHCTGCQGNKAPFYIHVIGALFIRSEITG